MMLTFLALAHMLNATYATQLLVLGGGISTFFEVAHMFDATQL